MANIFNDSSQAIRESGGSTNGNFTNLTVQNLIAQNAAIDNLNVDVSAIVASLEVTNLANHSIVTVGSGGALNGLAVGSNNDVLISNGLDALWSNSLQLQNLQTNTLKIPTTLNGDLIVFNSSSQAQRLGVGTSGQFLISDGTNPTWNNLPNPLILGGLQVNGNVQLTTFPNSTIITDPTGFIVSEQPQYATSGTVTFNTTPTQLYGNATWTMSNNSWYKIKVAMTTLATLAFYGDIQIAAGIQQYFYYPGSQTQTIINEIIYQYTGASSATVGIAINAQSVSGTASITALSIYVERIPVPNIHL